MHRFYALFFLVFFLPSVEAQTLRGTVRDGASRQPLAGATLELRAERAGAAFLTAATDSAGFFVFEELRPGYYRCTATRQGYEAQTLAEISIAAGKDREVELLLQPAAAALPDVTITASAPGGRPFRPLSEIPLTREQTLRFPATFFDPARLALAYPGVAGADDQANGLVIRGNGPGALRWRLEGVDVVNPNHLTNAGTFADRPALASGGVLLFSAQLLDNSALLTGAFPAGYGDALGGVMDIGLRRGNPFRHEFTVQAGLIGLDLAAEGPLGPRGKHSYLANYRYSTVGLLGQMGVPLGDETINFQDFSFKLSFAGKKGGQWSVFGVGGLNETLFDRKTDSSEIKIYKDLFDIEFYSKTAIAGVSNVAPLGARTTLRTSIVTSAQRNERTQRGPTPTETDRQEEWRTGVSAVLNHQVHRSLALAGGAQVQLVRYALEKTPNEIEEPVTTLFERINATVWQPWLSADVRPGQGRLQLTAGLHATLLRTNAFFEPADRVLEPRFTLVQRLGQQHRISLIGGGYSQTAPWWYYLVPVGGEARPSKLLRAHHGVLAYRWTPSVRWAFKAEVFRQYIYRVPVAAQPGSAFSLINMSEFMPLPAIQLTGKGRNHGLELGVERYLAGGWFLLANTTLFRAETFGSDQVWRRARWNARYIGNFTAGKEWQRDMGNNRTRAFGLNGRVTANGGFREQAIDVAASEAAATTVFDTGNGFTIQQPGFFRVDLRVYWKRSIGNRRNSTFAMDFQNATFGENIAYRYYDPYTKQVETKLQLGLIPNLSWRMEF